jgi:AraC family transcriptional regulator, regulatory protein of adaptative response / methylated-DNA-[protein]-cysteine methyltransferase
MSSLQHVPAAAPPFSNDDDRWSAVRRRQRAAEGAFVYSVRTTGVYCRPSCPARLPLQKNVRFHLTCADAEKAGFRPCKRCRPKEMRLAGDTSIRFAVSACSLGSVLVAASETGICAILLGDDPDVLARDLRARFPAERLIVGDGDFAWVARVIGFVEAPRSGLDLPLDTRGTAFQRRVWRAVREIPAGSTASYAQLAKRIGAPNAVRAVAQACGANAIAVAIPCHRVVRSDGALSGYRWGVARKRTLLEREAAA